MFNALEKVFKRVDLPYFRQGSAAETLPDKFFTFWNISTREIDWADNGIGGTVWHWGVWLYSRRNARVYSDDAVAKFCQYALEAGFLIVEPPCDQKSAESDFVCRYVEIDFVDRHCGK